MRKVTIPALAALFVTALTATLFGDTGSFVDSRDGKVYQVAVDRTPREYIYES